MNLDISPFAKAKTCPPPCGRVFHTEVANRTYCCPKCRRRAERARARIVGRERDAEVATGPSVHPYVASAMPLPPGTFKVLANPTLEHMEHYARVMLMDPQIGQLRVVGELPPGWRAYADLLVLRPFDPTTGRDSVTEWVVGHKDWEPR